MGSAIVSLLSLLPSFSFVKRPVGRKVMLHVGNLKHTVTYFSVCNPFQPPLSVVYL